MTKELTIDEQHTLLKREAATILDFACGPILRAAKLPFVYSWVTGSQPVTIAEHVYGVTLLTLAIHQLCRDKGIEPYCSTDGTRLALQALATSALSVNNMFAVDYPDNPLLAQTKHDITPAIIKSLLQPLAPCMATGIEQAWLTQVTNEQNPLTRLVQIAELTHNIIGALNTMSGGNRNASIVCEDALKELIFLSRTINDDLRYIAEGLASTICDLLGIVPEEFANATDS